MDFFDLVKTYGLWPATTLAVGFAFYRDLRAQIDDLKAQIKELTDAAGQVTQAKNLEIQEWKNRVLDGHR